MKKKTIITLSIINILIIGIGTTLLLHQNDSYSYNNSKNENKTLLVKDLLNQNTILTANEEVGLHSASNNYYYFKGNVINNYLKINDEYWQIISIDNKSNIKIIKTEPINNTKYKINNNYLNYNYLDSDVHVELINYFNNNLKDIKSIIKTDYCVEYQEKCLRSEQEYIGLVNQEELSNIIIEENNLSFIKSTDFWIMSNNYLDTEINQAYFGFINNNGLLDETIIDDEKYIVPVITLDKNTTITGTGTIDNPYIITD